MQVPKREDACRRQLGQPAGAPSTTGAASRSNPSGSGTLSSGGEDDNGDASRDKMPERDRTVRPESQQHHPNEQ
ncbi:hypothetical protein TSA1_14545 [Bradyrhizobium nitroreducens]|uniref:Uncharacterized protein n=1 Tax=Bradyrhizobium nitroreducens TaxID=709803 RepID=A0A2M6UBF5_9BRAD|nr:hypothetical protein [Bradyrhizobium nitroreducens]PIT01858.1 hypothetical protein TSA1_14545 [Bradyrhizobium nitroreducens]